MKMKMLILSILIGIFYVSNVSGEFVNFVNEEREFSCVGNNIKWYLPNGKLVPDNKAKYSIQNISEQASKLTISKINALDIGEYRCATDENDERFLLKIYYPLAVGHNAASQAVKENNDIQLRCKIVGIPCPAPEIKWYFGSRLLVPSDNIEISNDKIVLRKVQRNQAGSYACVVTQKLRTFSNHQQRETELIVEHGLSHTRPINKELFGNPGEMVTLACSATTVPNAHFIWLLNGYQIHDNVEVFNDVSRLFVEVDSASYSTNYTCLASYENEQQVQSFVIQPRPENSNASKLNSVAVLLFSISFLGFLA